MHFREILASNETIVSIEALTNELLNESGSDDEALDDLLLLSELKKVISVVTSNIICLCNSFQLLELDDEVALMESLRGIFQQMTMSSTIMRPYDQHYTTPEYDKHNKGYIENVMCFFLSGCNRVMMENFKVKYPVGIFRSLFRFDQEHVIVLLEALQV